MPVWRQSLSWTTDANLDPSAGLPRTGSDSRATFEYRERDHDKIEQKTAARVYRRGLMILPLSRSGWTISTSSCCDSPNVVGAAVR